MRKILHTRYEWEILARQMEGNADALEFGLEVSLNSGFNVLNITIPWCYHLLFNSEKSYQNC